MKTTFLIAWRNIWRNKRRSFITMGSIFMAVLLSVFMRSMQLGSYDAMTKAGVSQVGYIQVHKTGFWDNQSINKSFVLTEELQNKLLSTDNVAGIIPRMSNFGLASSGENTKAAYIIGTQAKNEDSHTGLSKKIIWGHYLDEGESGILIAENLAKYLKLAEIQETKYTDEQGNEKTKKKVTMLEDSLVIISSGYQGISANGLFPIAGIVSLPTPQENSSLIYMNLNTAQDLFSPYIPNLVSTVSLDLNNPKIMDKTMKLLRTELDDNYELMTWEEMLTELVQEIMADNASGILMLGLLYIIVGFGLLGTVLMMTMERRKEMAVTISIGMHRSRMALILWIETLLLGITGVIIGELISLPFIYYLFKNPIPLTGELATMMESYNMEAIMPFSISPDLFLNQGIIVFIISLVASFYPIITVYKLKLVEAFHR